jgi:hypothetical protein
MHFMHSNTFSPPSTNHPTAGTGGEWKTLGEEKVLQK